MSQPEGHILHSAMASRAGTLRSPETPSMYGNSTRENRETPGMPVVVRRAGRRRPVSRTADMHVSGESDGCVVPTKGPNKGEHGSPAEDLEGRQPTKENTGQQARVPDTAPDMDESRRLLGVRKAHPNVRFDARHPR